MSARASRTPEPFLRAAWLAGIDPAEAVAWTTAVTGATAGLAAGMKTIFWPEKPMAGPPGAVVINSADELAGRTRLARLTVSSTPTESGSVPVGRLLLVEDGLQFGEMPFGLAGIVVHLAAPPSRRPRRTACAAAGRSTAP